MQSNIQLIAPTKVPCKSCHPYVYTQTRDPVPGKYRVSVVVLFYPKTAMYVYRFLLGSLFLLFHHGDSTRSLPQSAIEELSGLYAKKNLLVLLASYTNETAPIPPNPFANVSKACVNAVLGLTKSKELLLRCKCDFLPYACVTIQYVC